MMEKKGKEKERKRKESVGEGVGVFVGRWAGRVGLASRRYWKVPGGAGLWTRLGLIGEEG